jgi:hypothetical protein
MGLQGWQACQQSCGPYVLAENPFHPSTLVSPQQTHLLSASPKK